MSAFLPGSRESNPLMGLDGHAATTIFPGNPLLVKFGGGEYTGPPPSYIVKTAQRTGTTMINRHLSYTAANSLPIKLFHHAPLMRSLLEDRKVIPVHIQLNPTNRCNRSCGFCSCMARDPEAELSLEAIRTIMREFRDLGAESVTITGGGEPCLHREISGIIRSIRDLGVEIGLVTNALDLGAVRNLDRLSWCRVSGSDAGGVPGGLAEHIRRASIDWAFSYVASEAPDIGNICDYIRFANEHRFTHVRVVPDLLRVDDVDIGKIREAVHRRVDDRLVIYQDRKTHTRGAEPCYISLLKPVVGADGNLYPCCGTQYAEAIPSLDYGPGMRMETEAIGALYRQQRFFRGGCSRCYYDDYNTILRTLLRDDIDHKKFV